MDAKLFINYRREDTRHAAGRLYDRLIQRFGDDQVFMDIDQIEPGEDFVEVINRKVGTCDVAIVAIGPRWLGATDESGKRRIDDEEDFVRMEIIAALQRNIRVIPVLLDGARMPRKQELPEALAPLSRRNAIELSETRFHADVNRLIEAVERSFRIVEKRAEPSATPVAPVSPVSTRPPESEVLPEASGSAAVAEWEARERAQAEAVRLAEEERQATQIAELKLAKEKKAADAEAARLAGEKWKREEAARYQQWRSRASRQRKKTASGAAPVSLAKISEQIPTEAAPPYRESERSQQDSAAAAEDQTRQVKSSQTTPAIHPVASIFAIAALREPDALNRYADHIYSVIRMVVGLMFAYHGGQKLLGFPPGGTPGLLDAMGLIGAWIELLGGFLVAFGLFTRLAAFVASGEMAVAYFMVHGPRHFFPIVNKGELAVLYCWFFLFVLFYGAGRWSIDAIMKVRQESPVRPHHRANIHDWSMNFLNRHANHIYSVMRLIVGLMFFCHGAQKIFGWFTPPGQLGGPLPPLMLVGGWIEIVAGLLVAVGLFTRIAAFVASGEMAVAFFMMHAPMGLIPYVNKGELAVVYCFVFFYMFLRGSGSWSIDAVTGKGKTSATTTA